MPNEQLQEWHPLLNNCPDVLQKTGLCTAGQPTPFLSSQPLGPPITRLKTQFDLSLPQLGPTGQPWPSDLVVVSHIVFSDSNI